jgi:hypothetical protein
MSNAGPSTRNEVSGRSWLVPPRCVSCRLSAGGSGTSGGTEGRKSAPRSCNYRAGYRIRTGDLQLGKLTLYR